MERMAVSVKAKVQSTTEDEYFRTENGAKVSVVAVRKDFGNTSETEPLVMLRYFGSEVDPDAPAMGAYWKNNF